MGDPDSELYKTLLDLSQAVAGHTDLETLSNSLVGSLSRVVSFFLPPVNHDPAHPELRLHAIGSNRPVQRWHSV